MTKPNDAQQTQPQAQPQAQTTAKRNAPQESDEIQYFDTTITKLVERENEETGEKEWVECMSDNLYPGEKLKRDEDDEKTEHKQELARAQAHDAAAKRKATEDEILKNKLDADSKNK